MFILLITVKLDRKYKKKTMEQRNTLFDKFFRDSEGNIVIAQPPNPPIIVWGVVSLLKLVFTDGLVNVGLDLIAYGSLFTWAWMELFQGVNYFRRTLGLVVLVGFVGARILSSGTV